MKTILLIIALIPSMYGISQTNIEIENFTRSAALYLGAPENNVNKSLLIQELKYVGDDYWGNYYVKHYTKNGSFAVLIDLGYETLPWYEYGKCLSKVTITYISNQSYASFFDYLDGRTIFKKISYGKYTYLAFDSPLIKILETSGYSTVIYEVSQKVDLVSANKNAYSLNFTISLIKDK